MKTYKRLPNGANPTQINKLGYTLKEADPDLRYCPYCEVWVDNRPAPIPTDDFLNGVPLPGEMYHCGKCKALVAFIPDPLPTRSELLGKIQTLRELLKQFDSGEWVRHIPAKDTDPDVVAWGILQEIERFIVFGG